MCTEPLFVIGAGGHAKVVLDALPLGEAGSIILVDDDPARVGELIMGHRIVGPAAEVDISARPFHVAIGANASRRRLQLAYAAARARPHSIVHPGACVARDTVIGDGSFVAAQSVIAPAARVGMGVIINHGAVVDHDCVVGNFAHIAPNATLGGGVRVGDDVLIGAGATILPGRRIGDGAIVAAGATIARDVDAGDVVIFAQKRKN